MDRGRFYSKYIFNSKNKKRDYKKAAYQTADQTPGSDSRCEQLRTAMDNKIDRGCAFFQQNRLSSQI